MTSINLVPFNRILSGYEKLEEVAVSVAGCSQLCQQYQKYGVRGYRLGDYRGAGYLHHYLNCTVANAPMLIYQEDYLIPLVFRGNEDSLKLFAEEYRLDAFFLLLDWLVKNQPAKAILNYDRFARVFGMKNEDRQVIDSAYLVFRVTEILDGAGFPLSHFSTVAEFIEWNRIYKLIDQGGIGRHRKIFDETDPQHMSELALVMEIIQLKYPQAQQLH